VLAYFGGHIRPQNLAGRLSFDAEYVPMSEWHSSRRRWFAVPSNRSDTRRLYRGQFSTNPGFAET
jgi:hypothetical protein